MSVSIHLVTSANNSNQTVRDSYLKDFATFPNLTSDIAFLILYTCAKEREREKEREIQASMYK